MVPIGQSIRFQFCLVDYCRKYIKQEFSMHSPVILRKEKKREKNMFIERELMLRILEEKFGINEELFLIEARRNNAFNDEKAKAILNAAIKVYLK